MIFFLLKLFRVFYGTTLMLLLFLVEVILFYNIQERNTRFTQVHYIRDCQLYITYHL